MLVNGSILLFGSRLRLCNLILGFPFYVFSLNIPNTACNFSSVCVMYLLVVMFVQDLVSMLLLSRPDPDPPPLNLPPDPLVVAPRFDPPDPSDPPDPPDLSLSRCQPPLSVDVALKTSGLAGSAVVSFGVCLSTGWCSLLPGLVFQLELWLSSARTCSSLVLATVDAGRPPPFTDLLNPSVPLVILLCALDIKCRYDFLFSLTDGSFMPLVGKSLALVRFTTAVCSPLPSLTQDIESLMIIFSCEILSSMVVSSSPAFCLDRSVFSALSCSAFMLLMSSGLSHPLPVPVSSPCGYIGDTFVSHVEPFTAVCRPLLVFVLNFDVIRWLSLPLWQVEELVLELSIQRLNIVVLSTLFFVEHVFFPYFPLLFSGCVAGSIVSKLTDTLLSRLRKGSANWCHVTYALTAIFLIVNSTPVVVSVSGYRSLNVLSKSHSSISNLGSFDVEVRGLLHDFSYLGVIIALILCMFVLRFVIAVCLAGLALLSSTLNNYSMD